MQQTTTSSKVLAKIAAFGNHTVLFNELHHLERQLDAHPCAALFEAPIGTWLPSDAPNRHGPQLERTLDVALASANRSVASLDAVRLWQLLSNALD